MVNFKIFSPTVLLLSLCFIFHLPAYVFKLLMTHNFIMFLAKYIVYHYTILVLVF